MSSPAASSSSPSSSSSSPSPPTDASPSSLLGVYPTLLLRWCAPGVLNVSINSNPLNSMTRRFWADMSACFARVAECGAVRVVLLTAEGRVFTAGLDLQDHADGFAGASSSSSGGGGAAGSSSGGATGSSSGSGGAAPTPDPARVALRVSRSVCAYQHAFHLVELCPQPVVCAIAGACIGGGVDLITGACIRYASADAYFCVKEVDVGMAADVGTLQRLPKVLGNASLAREWCYTARKVTAAEALAAGLLSRVLPTRDELSTAALQLCVVLAAKSPLALAGTKHLLNYSRDHSVAEANQQVQLWNATALQSADVSIAMRAAMNKQQPIFSNL